MIEQTNIWKNLNWFAIQAKPHQENLAAAQVAKLDLEVFLPRIKRWKSVCGVSRVLTLPLFPGYFFARFAPLVSMDSVRFSFGVLRVVGTKQFPIPVSPEIVSGIQDRTGADNVIEIAETDFKPGDSVRIEQGPLEGFMGIVERETDGGRRVAILLETLNHARVLIEKHWVEKSAAV